MECYYESKTAVISGGSNAGEKQVLGAADPTEGVRLIRAFLKISDPLVRQKIIDMVEQGAIRFLAN
jgi:hypothetical protein